MVKYARTDIARKVRRKPKTKGLTKEKNIFTKVVFENILKGFKATSLTTNSIVMLLLKSGRMLGMLIPPSV